jgi:hypothetical protein
VLNPTPGDGPDSGDAVAHAPVRVHPQNGEWTVNGKTWMEVVNSGYQFVWANPGSGDTEIWEFSIRPATGSIRCMYTSST